MAMQNTSAGIDKAAPDQVELTFASIGAPGEEDVVVVQRTRDIGPGGHNVYCDPSGIVRAEVSGIGEVRMLATSGRQEPAQPLRCRFLDQDAVQDAVQEAEPDAE